MSSTPGKRTRSERVASLQLETYSLKLWWDRLTTGASFLRITLSLLVVIVATLVLRGWDPPFTYRQGYIPPRSIISREAFEMLDSTKTQVLQAEARRNVICVYENRSQPIRQLRSAIKDQLFRFLSATDISELNASQREALDSFLARTADEPEINPQEALASFHKLLAEEGQQQKFDRLLQIIFDDYEKYGLLRSLMHETDEGKQDWIKIIQSDRDTNAAATEAIIPVTQVYIRDVSAELKKMLHDEFNKQFNQPDADIVSGLVHNYVAAHLPTTLTIREDLSEQARKKAFADVRPAMIPYFPSISTLAQAGKPLQLENLKILRAEYDRWLTRLSFSDRLIRLVAFVGMMGALFLLCGIFIHFQLDRDFLFNTGNFIRLLVLTLACLVLAKLTAFDPWRAEIVPLVMCSMAATIAFGRSLALILITAISLAITLSLGMDLAEFVILTSASVASALWLGRIRTREKPIYVGLAAAVVAGLTTVGVGIMVGQLNGSNPISDPISVAVTQLPNSGSLIGQLVGEAGRQMGFVVLASLLTAGLLPFIERLFGVQTDLSLLQLGDASHPLLRQLAQRAPGTYNHSINVAAIAEAAADSIGAHGLLTRVGAYFHDIGKMFKPNYFVENQSQGVNRHDSLQPAMSTLVIIAHVKDGSDLARQHRLPKRITDFVEQHHGTTLVEYFFRQAAKKSEEDPNAEEVSELNFRYPGPKPQSLEAAVLMLADAVESASRSLIEPTPMRIQNLVDQISMKRLLDGQFDECGLTLRQLDAIKRSLVKTLTAIYHGRVKYPGQQTA